MRRKGKSLVRGSYEDKSFFMMQGSNVVNHPPGGWLVYPGRFFSMNYLGLVTSAGKLKCSQTSFDEGEFRVAEFIHENFCSCRCSNLVYEATEKALGDWRKPDRCPQST